MLFRLFDRNFVEVLRDKIESKFLGELRANECVLLNTAHPNLKNVCCVALPQEKNFIDTYSLFWSVLSTIWVHNMNIPFEKRISSILCPSFHNPSSIPLGRYQKIFIVKNLFLTFSLNFNRNF